MRRVCADPFKRHKKLIRKNVKEASQLLISLVKDQRIQKGVYLCCSCRIKVKRDPESLPEIETLDEDRSTPLTPRGPSSSTETSVSSPLARVDAESLMPLLGISPVRASKFGDNCIMILKAVTIFTLNLKADLKKNKRVIVA